MSNIIAPVPSAQTTNRSGPQSGVLASDQNLAATTFADFLIAHVGELNISEEDIAVLRQDLADGKLDDNSPVLRALANIGQVDGLTESNAFALRELAGLFVDLNNQGEINLSASTLQKLNDISTGASPATELVSLIQDKTIFTELKQAIGDQRAYGLANVHTDLEGFRDDVIEQAEAILEEELNGESAPAGLGVLLKRLEVLQDNVQARSEFATTPQAQDTFNRLEQQIANLIERVENAIAQQANLGASEGLIFNPETGEVFDPSAPSITAPIEGFVSQRRGVRNTLNTNLTGQNSAGQPSSNGQAQTNVGIQIKPVAAKINGTAQSRSFNTISVSSDSVSSDQNWFNANNGGDIDFTTRAEVKGVVNESFAASLRAVKAAATSATRNILPPSPAVQQVLVHIQKNAQNQSKLSIQLNPSELGRVDVRLTVGRDGRTTAAVYADRQETLSLLEKDSAHLERALQNAGLETGTQDLSFNLRGDNADGFETKGRQRSRAQKEGDLSIDGHQLSSTELDAAVFDKYHVNYKA